MKADRPRAPLVKCLWKEKAMKAVLGYQSLVHGHDEKAPEGGGGGDSGSEERGPGPP